jgi:adenylosuccinate synthase
LIVLRHSCRINGYDFINLTKLDVLDKLPEIKVAIKYIVEGKELVGFPGELQDFSRGQSSYRYLLADLELLSKVEVEYVTLPGWQTSIEQITSYEDLPENCKKYVEFIEEWTKVPIKWIGVGPLRESMLIKS